MTHRMQRSQAINLIAAAVFFVLLSCQAVLAQKPAPATTKPAPSGAGRTAPGKKKVVEPTPAAAVPGQEAVNQRIIDVVRAIYTNLPPNYVISIVNRLPSKIQGLETVTVEVTDGVNPSRIEVLVSEDNKFAILQPMMVDLAVDPFALNMKKINTTNSPVMGNRNAKVTIVEYSDFECPKCAEAYQTMEKDIMKKYGDRVKLVYKSIPLPNHSWAEPAAIAGLCAYQQKNDAFWALYRAFFDKQATITPEKVKLEAMAAVSRAGIDMKKFEDCYDKKLTAPQIQADIAEAGSLNLSGTPLFMVNGRPIAGAATSEIFQKVIEEELKKVAR
jgi:protein-disulfide isomerase